MLHRSRVDPLRINRLGLYQRVMQFAARENEIDLDFSLRDVRIVQVVARVQGDGLLHWSRFSDHYPHPHSLAIIL